MLKCSVRHNQPSSTKVVGLGPVVFPSTKENDVLSSVQQDVSFSELFFGDTVRNFWEGTSVVGCGQAPTVGNVTTAVTTSGTTVRAASTALSRSVTLGG